MNKHVITLTALAGILFSFQGQAADTNTSKKSQAKNPIAISQKKQPSQQDAEARKKQEEKAKKEFDKVIKEFNEKFKKQKEKQKKEQAKKENKK